MGNMNTIIQQMRFKRRKGSEDGLLGNLFLLFGVGVNTIHFDDGGTLGQVGRHNYLVNMLIMSYRRTRLHTGTLISSLMSWILWPDGVVLRPSNTGSTFAAERRRCLDVSVSLTTSLSLPSTISSSSASSSSKRAVSSCRERDATSILVACASAFCLTFFKCSSSLFSASQVMTSLLDQ